MEFLTISTEKINVFTLNLRLYFQIGFYQTANPAHYQKKNKTVR